MLNALIKPNLMLLLFFPAHIAAQEPEASPTLPPNDIVKLCSVNGSEVRYANASAVIPGFVVCGKISSSAVCDPTGKRLITKGGEVPHGYGDCSSGPRLIVDRHYPLGQTIFQVAEGLKQILTSTGPALASSSANFTRTQNKLLAALQGGGDDDCGPWDSSPSSAWNTPGPSDNTGSSDGPPDMMKLLMSQSGGSFAPAGGGMRSGKCSRRASGAKKDMGSPASGSIFDQVRKIIMGN